MRLAEEERARKQELARLAKERAEKEAEEQRRIDEEVRIKAALEKAEREEKSKARRDEALKREREEMERQKEAAQEERRLQAEKEKAAQREKSVKEKEEGEERQRQKAERLRRIQEDQEKLSREKAEKRRQKEAQLAEQLEIDRAANETKAAQPKNLGKPAGTKRMETNRASKLSAVAPPVSPYSELLEKAIAKHKEGKKLLDSASDLENDRSMSGRDTICERLKAAYICFSLSVAFFEKIPETDSGFNPFWYPMEESLKSYVYALHAAHVWNIHMQRLSSQTDDKAVDALRKAFTSALKGQEKLSHLIFWHEKGFVERIYFEEILDCHVDSFKTQLPRAKQLLEKLKGEQFLLSNTGDEKKAKTSKPVPPIDEVAESVAASRSA